MIKVSSFCIRFTYRDLRLLVSLTLNHTRSWYRTIKRIIYEKHTIHADEVNTRISANTGALVVTWRRRWSFWPETDDYAMYGGG